MEGRINLINKNRVSQQDNFKLLILIMALTSLVVGAISIFSLYATAFDQHRLRLVETVKSQARLIESIASYQAFDNNNPLDNDWQKTTLQQIKNGERCMNLCSFPTNPILLS